MSEKICPLCGKETKDDEVFCHNCQEIAENSYPSQLLNKNEVPEPEFTNVPEIIDATPVSDDAPLEHEPVVDQQEEHTIIDAPKNKGFYQNNKKALLFIAVALVLVLLVGGVASYFRLEDRRSEATELAYWNQSVDQNTPLAYSKYLVRYPNGHFSEMARNKIKELREKEIKEWEVVKRSNDINALYAFLTDHPSTPYGTEIKYLTDSLSWAFALKENTADCYLAYMENVKLGHLAGDYLNLAKEKYDYLSQLKTVEGKELEEIKDVLRNIFKQLSSGKSKQLEQYIAPRMVRFYNVENQPLDSVVSLITGDLKNRKIKNISYTVSTGGLEVIRDKEGIYFTTLPVDMEITYSDRKKKKEKLTQQLNIELDNQQKLRSLYEKNK